MLGLADRTVLSMAARLQDMPLHPARIESLAGESAHSNRFTAGYLVAYGGFPPPGMRKLQVAWKSSNTGRYTWELWHKVPYKSVPVVSSALAGTVTRCPWQSSRVPARRRYFEKRFPGDRVSSGYSGIRSWQHSYLERSTGLPAFPYVTIRWENGFI